MNGSLKKKLKQNLGQPLAVDPTTVRRVCQTAGNIYGNTPAPAKLRTFLREQLLAAAKTIWPWQALVMAVLCVLFQSSLTHENLLFSWYFPRFIGIAAVVTAMTGVPALGRSQRYGMSELEQTAYFSFRGVVFSRLVAIGIGDGLMLGGILILALLQSIAGTAELLSWLVMPFAAAGAGCLFILRHFKQHELLAEMVFCAALLLFFRICPESFYEFPFGLWGMAILLVMGMLIQLKKYIVEGGKSIWN